MHIYMKKKPPTKLLMIYNYICDKSIQIHIHIHVYAYTCHHIYIGIYIQAHTYTYVIFKESSDSV